MEPRFTFDRVANLYDEVRAGYPSALFQSLNSRIPAGGSLLEVGCGTGKATVGFADAGLDIVALDPGPSMIAEAKVNLDGYASVRFVQSTFEDWTPDADGFDIIAAAQAWHWVPPEAGFAKAAELLKPDGVLAIFGNDWTVSDAAVRGVIDGVYLRLAPELRNSPLGTWYRSDAPLPVMIAESGFFRDVLYERYVWSRTASLEAYLAMLRTLSNHQGLDPNHQRSLIGGLREAACAFGDTIELSYTTHLHHCRQL